MVFRVVFRVVSSVVFSGILYRGSGRIQLVLSRILGEAAAVFPLPPPIITLSNTDNTQYRFMTKFPRWSSSKGVVICPPTVAHRYFDLPPVAFLVFF